MDNHEHRAIEKDQHRRGPAGDRWYDPRPHCNCCGLAVVKPHRSEAACVRALRTELSSLRAMLRPGSVQISDN